MQLEQTRINGLWGGGSALPVPGPVPVTLLLSAPAPGDLNLGLPQRLTLHRSSSDQAPGGTSTRKNKEERDHSHQGPPRGSASTEVEKCEAHACRALPESQAARAEGRRGESWPQRQVGQS